MRLRDKIRRQLEVVTVGTHVSHNKKTTRKLVKWVIRTKEGKIVPISRMARDFGEIKQFRPGVWYDAGENPTRCTRGLHCTINKHDFLNLWKPRNYHDCSDLRLGWKAELWEVEAAGPGDRFPSDSKHVFRFMKLVRRIR